MNSFATFALQDRNTFSYFNRLPNLSDSNPFHNFNKPQLEIPNLGGFVSPIKTFSPTNTYQRISSLNSLSPLTNYSLGEPAVPVISAEINNLLLTWKLQQTVQNELFKSEMRQLLEVKNSLLEKLQQQQLQSDPQTQSNQRLTPTTLLNQVESVPTTSVKVEIPGENIHQTVQSLQKKSLKAQIKDIIHYVLDNFGRVNEDQFDEEKIRYSFDKDLVMVFELLSSKYASTIKTKEEMVKYTLRRAFKFIKSNLKKEMNANTKCVCKTLCSKYFGASQDEISKIGNEEDFLKCVLPFRKNSKNKTMNTSFISEIFSSEEFYKDYENYLQSFDNILEVDNKNKIDRMANYIEECIKKKKIRDIRNYKRIPWPKLWIISTKKIAQDLPNIGNQVDQFSSNPVKKCKQEDGYHTHHDAEDHTENGHCHSDTSSDSHSDC
jgi:hypothetical protein